MSDGTGKPDIKVRRFQWGLLRLLFPIVKPFRELTELRYLWTTPIHMGNARLIQVLGAEPRTTLEVAVRETLIGIGCIPPAPPRHGVGAGSAAGAV